MNEDEIRSKNLDKIKKLNKYILLANMYVVGMFLLLTILMLVLKHVDRLDNNIIIGFYIFMLGIDVMCLVVFGIIQKVFIKYYKEHCIREIKTEKLRDDYRKTLIDKNQIDIYDFYVKANKEINKTDILDND